MIDPNYLSQFVNAAFLEDVGDGDHTSLACIPENHHDKAQLIIKDTGILAGIEVAQAVFQRCDPELKTTIYLQDGTPVKHGDIAFIVEGRTRSILKAERLVLNLMQRMSGIATETYRLTQLLKSTSTKLLDTRKTAPGMRLLDKEAVRIGGGVNHRIGLFDMILIKDNHIDFAGGIIQAIEAAQRYNKETNRNLKIEVEVRTMEDIQLVLKHGGVDRIMFDNFTPEQTLQAVKLVNHTIETESSGGITERNMLDYANCGVDYISMGSLTHHVKALDMSLKALEQTK